uniref:INTS6/SAGE1/DDX26B/CT45 C-terminal domain-containing protein n=1 Tax=Canis lupus dingo TaxID=286419 RepID=A0A8C0LL40_CANLU
MSDKAEEFAVGPENQMKRRGEPISPPPSKRMMSMALLSMKQEGEGVSYPGGSAMSLEELMNMAGDGISHSQFDSLPHDLTSVIKGGLLQEPGSNALVGRIITTCLSADDPKVTGMSVSGEMPDKLQIPVEISAEMKQQLKKEIQRFGQKYERVFKLLEGVQGPLELREKICCIFRQGNSKVGIERNSIAHWAQCSAGHVVGSGPAWHFSNPGHYHSEFMLSLVV